jgi:hypothetical protein
LLNNVRQSSLLWFCFSVHRIVEQALKGVRWNASTENIVWQVKRRAIHYYDLPTSENVQTIFVLLPGNQNRRWALNGGVDLGER